MLKIISDKLEYWTEIMRTLSTRKVNPSDILLAIADDIESWNGILKAVEDASESESGVTEIIIYNTDQKNEFLN